MLIRAVNDNPEIAGAGGFGPARWALFLPTAVVIVGYTALLAFLWIAGRSDGALFRLGLVILALGTPIMLAHAILRTYTVKLQPMAQALYVHRGFPRAEAIEIPYPMIRSTRNRRGIGGYLTGSGTLVIELVTGGTVVVCDLENAAGAKKTIDAILEGDDSGEPLLPDMENSQAASAL